MLLLSLILLYSCIKLQEKKIDLAIRCPNCVKELTEEVLEMEGVFYVRYEGLESDTAIHRLVVKHDEKIFREKKLNDMLNQKGYTNVSRDSIAPKPSCCN